MRAPKERMQLLSSAVSTSIRSALSALQGRSSRARTKRDVCHARKMMASTVINRRECSSEVAGTNQSPSSTLPNLRQLPVHFTDHALVVPQLATRHAVMAQQGRCAQYADHMTTTGIIDRMMVPAARARSLHRPPSSVQCWPWDCSFSSPGI